MVSPIYTHSWYHCRTVNNMRVVEQSHKLPIVNVELESGSQRRSKHGRLLPNSIRCIICGPSNCGKTNVMIGLLSDPNWLKFENVYVYSKSLQQPKYQFLQQVLEPIRGLGYYPFTNNDEVLDLSLVKPNSIFIFDDIICEKQKKIREYFCMGRHKSVDCFYLAQTYSRIGKHLVRDNPNLLVVFPQDLRNLQNLYNDNVGTDMTFQQFRELCTECWREKYGFLVIDKESAMSAGRYRKGFDHYIYLK